MLKRTITYEDFDGEKQSEDFYFNLTKSELIELEVEYNAGFVKSLEAIIESQDKQRLVSEFKKIILLSYGQKSDDGKRFVKSDKLREEFTQTAAYNSLFLELALQEDKAATFINGIIPQDMIEAPDQDKPLTPPAPPAVSA